MKASLPSKEKARMSLKVPSKRGQDGPTPALKKKRRPHVEVNKDYRITFSMLLGLITSLWFPVR